MEQHELTTAEKEFITQIVQTTQLTGDAAALRQALSLIDSIINKLKVELDEPLDMTNQ